MYVSGHNIVIYNLEDGSQSFIQGSVNADMINFITLSLSGRFLAYCEKSIDSRAQVTIHDISSGKKRKTIPEPESESLDIECKEFLGCAFSPVLEKTHLVTLSGEGDWCAILWQWDQMKMLAKFDLGVFEPEMPLSF